MPLIPTGLGGQFFDRIRDRVRKELGVEPTPQEMQEPPQDPSFGSRIKQMVRQQLGLDPGAPPPQSGQPGQPGMPPPPMPPQQDQEQPTPPGPPRSLDEIKQRIQQAGRNLPPVMLRMLYNNNWRDVEPYSYRYRDADDPHIPLFFGYCHKDQRIEAYKLKKIQDVQVTQRPFQAKFVVEF